MHHKAVLGSGTVFTTIVVAFFAMMNTSMPDAHKPAENNITRVEGKEHIGAPVIESPFKNTLAMVRWNTNDGEHMPLLSKYAPFFHTMHFSMPEYLSEEQKDFHNLTHDSWESNEYPYLQIASTMQLILNDDSASEIKGLLYYHFDAWIDPLAYTGANMDNIWFPDVTNGPRFECMTSTNKYPEWRGWGPDIHKSAMVVGGFDRYVVDPNEFCVGWTDIYYIPRRFFEDYIFLASIFGWFSVVHEVAVPTMVHIIDQSRRAHPNLSVMEKFEECWGASNPDVLDVLWNRCGHRLDYLNEMVINAHYDRVDAEARMLGVVIGETKYATHQGFSPATTNSEGNVVESSQPAVVETNKAMDCEKNLGKSVRLYLVGFTARLQQVMGVYKEKLGSFDDDVNSVHG
jgi:hypothetical protein